MFSTWQHSAKCTAEKNNRSKWFFKFFLQFCLFLLPLLPKAQPGPGNDSVLKFIFPYRAWSIAIDAKQLDVEETYFTAAVAKAPEYKINTIEFHDNVLEAGIIESLVEYDSFSVLKNKAALTYGKDTITKGQRQAYRNRFQTMLAKAKQNNIAINVWYHVLRDIPEEVQKEYPQINDIETGFIWTYISSTLAEFFKEFPSVNRLTLISLHETPSILKKTGKYSREEILSKLYMTIYNACKQHNKELIIRDFIVDSNDYATFWNILEDLPKDIFIMTKSVLADWSHLNLAINPYMHLYKGRKLIVEFDLYGEWSGRGDFPVCYPDDIIRHLRESKAVDAIGAVGRLIHDTRPASDLPFKTIFDSPLDINCFVFSKYLSEPMPWLGQTHAKWHEDMEAINKSTWMIWANERYGKAASVAVVRALERTAEINSLTFNIAGLSTRYYVWYPTFFKMHPPNSSKVVDTWNVFRTQLEAVGIDYLKDEKKRALKLADESLKDIMSTKGKISPAQHKQLQRLFENMIIIIKAYDLALDGFYQVYLSKKANDFAGRKKASDALKSYAKEIGRLRGTDWYFDISRDVNILANEVLKGETTH